MKFTEGVRGVAANATCNMDYLLLARTTATLVAGSMAWLGSCTCLCGFGQPGISRDVYLAPVVAGRLVPSTVGWAGSGIDYRPTQHDFDLTEDISPEICSRK